MLESSDGGYPLHNQARNAQGSGWRWREGRVDPAEDHFELHYGSGEADPASWVLAARVGRPTEKVFPVEFNSSVAATVNAAVAELNFYLVEKGEADPWVYAQYHCGTCSNWYSSIHWSFRKGGSHSRD